MHLLNLKTDRLQAGDQQGLTARIIRT